MGGAVSSGRDNGELIDNLVGGNYIRSRDVERVFRALDRADYMTREARDQAYKDVAWRHGPLHLSAPCIYSEVMEALELSPGLSFLNVGSGTGYLSTLVGLILGSGGISDGVEVHSAVVEYATKRLGQFIENSPVLDEFDFCEPRFYNGNALCLAPLQAPYDRVYCGAACPEEYENYFKQLIKIGGILVMPLNDNLVQVKRVGDAEWTSKNLLNVTFASLRIPDQQEAAELVHLDAQTPPRLQALARGAVRGALRGALCARHPELRAPPPRPPPAKKPCPRRICIPIEDESDVEGLNALHDLDRRSGAGEMNALLSLVLSMGPNRVAGALRCSGPDLLSSDDEPHHPAAPAEGEAGSDAERSAPLEAQAERLEDAQPADCRPRLPPAVPHPHSHSDATSTGSESEARGREAARRTRTRTRSLLHRELRGVLDMQPDSPDEEGSGSEARRRGARWSARRGRGRGARADGPDDMPAEVEIYLGKMGSGEAATSREMDWDAEDEDESDDSVEEAPAAADKPPRQKLDSGIGDMTPSTESSPTSAGCSRRLDDGDGEGDGDCGDEQEAAAREPSEPRAGSRRKRLKCGRYHYRNQQMMMEPCSESGESGDSGPSGVLGAARRRRRERRSSEGGDARRVRLSLLMKRSVKELPLPYALKKYVNLGRCFQF
ncbi:hypothetical protein MSG28_003725 [Choristoneura fumiferana]|uniref:Uncharacterized protein n=1 Tax=Choristoneura fumiferana TaxID=7141 RepID=A0ACC0KG61_CHOFU|nr:hypothetical protein MSG28_003725 [Choristoneura fumiferana]